MDLGRQDLPHRTGHVSVYHKWREFLLIRDTPGWQNKWPLGPVRFDVRCEIHNVEYLEIYPDQLPGAPEEFRALLTCCHGRSNSI